MKKAALLCLTGDHHIVRYENPFTGAGGRSEVRKAYSGVVRCSRERSVARTHAAAGWESGIAPLSLRVPGWWMRGPSGLPACGAGGTASVLARARRDFCGSAQRGDERESVRREETPTSKRRSTDNERTRTTRSPKLTLMYTGVAMRGVYAHSTFRLRDAGLGPAVCPRLFATLARVHFADFINCGTAGTFQWHSNEYARARFNIG
jgi:hypothetical protein